MLITFNPEDSKDFNVEGGGGLPKLPVGVYDIDMAIVNIDAVQKDNAPLKLALTYAVVNPKSTTLSAGQQFGDYINIQNPSPIAPSQARLPHSFPVQLGKLLQSRAAAHIQSLPPPDALGKAIFDGLPVLHGQFGARQESLVQEFPLELVWLLPILRR